MTFPDNIKKAALYLRRFQDWRRGDDVRSMPGAGIDGRELGKAIDLILTYFGYPEPLTNCENCKYNGEHHGFTGCIREAGLQNKECKFEEKE